MNIQNNRLKVKDDHLCTFVFTNGIEAVQAFKINMTFIYFTKNADHSFMIGEGTNEIYILHIMC